MAEHKIGDGHAEAMGRQGLRELRGAFYPESNVAQTPEYGLYGTKTQGEIAQDRRDDGMSEEKDVHGKSVVDDRLQQAQDRDDRDEDRDHDLEK